MHNIYNIWAISRTYGLLNNNVWVYSAVSGTSTDNVRTREEQRGRKRGTNGQELKSLSNNIVRTNQGAILKRRIIFGGRGYDDFVTSCDKGGRIVR